MRTLIISSVLLTSLSLLSGCAVSADPEAVDSASQAVVPPPTSCGGDELVTRTQGFWKNHCCVVKGEATGYPLVPVSLGSSAVLDKYGDVHAYLSIPPQGGNKQLILGHQLLAAKLNVAAFNIGGFDWADWDADGTLETVDELLAIADGLYDAGSNTNRVKMATILDKLNNAGDAEDLWFDPTCNSPPPVCE
ncbi:MAG: hypothetical protein IT372_36285 [Polyangiaceae bacterium]|nr:hypothetical protein [Polyangiaceae bacterium]